MKKISLFLMLAVMGIVTMTSCQETREKEMEGIAVKIQNNEKLTDKDYTAMIEYVGRYAEAAQPIIDNIVNGNDSLQAQQQLKELTAQYPAVGLIRDCIKLSPASAFNEDNLALLQKYGGYEEFSMPLSISYQTDPKNAGLEMQTPTEEDNGVIAAPVLTTEVEKPEHIN